MAGEPSRGLLRRAVPLVVALFLLGWAAFGRDPFPRPRQPLRVALHEWIGYAPFHRAAELGLLDPSRVQLNRLSSAPVAAVALHAGALDAVALTLDEALRVLQEKRDVRIVLAIDESAGADAIVAHEPYSGLAALRGRRIGVERGAVGEYLLSRAFEIHGLRASDVEVVPLSPDRHRTAWDSDEIDAIVTFEPLVSPMVASSGRVVFDSREIPGEIVDVLVVRADVLATRRDDLAHLLDAWFAVLEQDRGAGSDGEAAIARIAGLSLEDTRRSLAGLRFPSRAEAGSLIAGPSPALLPRTIRIRSWMLDRMLLRENVEPSRLFGADVDRLHADALHEGSVREESR